MIEKVGNEMTTADELDHIRGLKKEISDYDFSTIKEKIINIWFLSILMPMIVSGGMGLQKFGQIKPSV